MWVCAHVCTWVYIWVCEYVGVCRCVHVHAGYVHMGVCWCARVHVGMFCAHGCMHGCVHVHVGVHSSYLWWQDGQWEVGTSNLPMSTKLCWEEEP